MSDQDDQTAAQTSIQSESTNRGEKVEKLEHHFLPPVLFFLSVVAVLLFWLFFPLNEPIPFPVNLLGLVFGGVGIYLLLSGNGHFRKADTNIHTFLKPRNLVVHGPFLFSRNPMYLGFVLLLFGLCFLIGASSPFVMVLFFFLIVNFWYIPYEERMCEQEFGEEYREYMRKVRRWV